LRALPFGQIRRTIRRPGFWLLAVLIVLITAAHYREEYPTPGFLSDFLADLGLDRHAFERICYLAPIVWAGFLFGRKGAFLTSLVCFACMLPRVVFISEYPTDAILESVAVFILGNVVAISFDALRKERQRRTQLEEAESALQFQLQVIKENERRLSALNQTSAILSQSLELKQVLEGAIENVADVMQLEAVLIHLVDEESGALVLGACRGVSAELEAVAGTIKLRTGLSGRVVETGEPLYVEDARHVAELSELWAAQSGVRSLLSLPMKSKRRVVGTLSVLTGSYRSFREDEVELLVAIASQVGVAIENAQLFEKERLATQRLAASERNYRGLFENANDAIWVHDLRGNITVANKACETQTGYTAEELIGMNVRDFLADEWRELAGRIRRGLLRNEPMEQPYEQRIIRKDGTEAILMLTTSLVVEDGAVTGYQNISRDVTEEKRMKENLDFYLGQVTKAQEEERLRIARELHDDTVQSLVVLSRELDALASSDRPIPQDFRTELEALWQQTNNLIQGVRRLSQDLRPPTLDRLGLLPALERLVSDVSEFSGIAVKSRVVGSERRLPEEAELMLFRIVQEALRNVWRHSQATQAEVSVEFDTRRIRITVEDNGVGFDLPKSVRDLSRTGKLGLVGMTERARLLGGTVALDTGPGKGARITVEVPV